MVSPPFLLVHSLDALPGEEVLLLVLDFGCVFQRGVHVAIAMRVRDPLHGFGRGFAERDRRAYSLNEQELVLLAYSLALFLSFPALCFWIFCSMHQKQKPVIAEGMLAAITTVRIKSMCSPPETVRRLCV